MSHGTVRSSSQWFGGQHVVQPPQPQVHKDKLAPIWPNGVEGRFNLAEATFAQFHVHDSRAHFNLLLPALDCETRVHVVTHSKDSLPEPTWH